MDKSDTFVSQYLTKVITEFNSGQAREHAYRPALKHLFESVITKLQAINDPKQSEHGAPDFALMHSKELSAGYVEAKDVTVNLDEAEKSEQMKRYLEYGSLILTNSLEFRFYRHGEKYGEAIIIASIQDGRIVPNEDSFFELEDTIKSFLTTTERIRSSIKLAKIMGDKARRIRDKAFEYVNHPDQKNNELRRIFESFQQGLMHDLTIEKFADMYAQTLVYGLFAARYEDPTLENFTRQEARELISASNPFLRSFFDHIAGANFDLRLAVIVNELCEVFTNCNVEELMNSYITQKKLIGEDKNTVDPVIHYYEDFLKEYDPALRKKMGVFYTPLPVVEFIVRSVDEILKSTFGLLDGLADTSKLSNDLHKVQILDPAVGTGTFINGIIKIIYERLIANNQEGRWPAYVHHDLLPRIHGFEIMMAAYTIAHLKLSIAFKQMKFTVFNRRLGIYLTNSLEQTARQEDLLSVGLSQSITDEGRQAAIIKNETPIMVVIGNPPYSVSSSNKGEWIQDQIKVYKEDLGERKINLDDDYIKFLRFAEYFIEKNKTGVVAMITNNSFIDGITHRQMRRHLLETFDEIYILDLHGNSKKKEKAPDGAKDENVFDIQQGVSINIFIRKNENKKELGSVNHAELFGKRDKKFEFLNKSNITNVDWKKLDYSEPYFFFVPKDFGLDDEYKKGFKVDEIFIDSNSGVKTDRDTLFIDFDRDALANRIKTLLSGDYDVTFKNEYKIKDSSGYKITQSLKGKVFDDKYIQPIQYRPFDYQWIYYEPGLISRSAFHAVQHIYQRKNLALLTSRSFPANQNFDRALATRAIPDIHSASDQTYVFPLYAYKDDIQILNLKPEIITEIGKIIEKVTAEDIFDYIYAVLHSPTYREKYKEFLKIDFPRVPYPRDKKHFDTLVTLGCELREIHLLESPKVGGFITTYSIAGSDTVEKVTYKDRKVFINAEQYFGNVPEIAWNFYIGGYQPAQKWLKDRKGRSLSNGDIEHYQKIIVALIETDRIMKEIDKTIPSWPMK